MAEWQEVLSNGVQIRFHPKPGFAGAAVALWLHNGVRHQETNEDGFAHLLEHMVMGLPAEPLGKTPYRVFERFGGRVNAQTGRELSAFYGVSPGDQAAELTTALVRCVLPKPVPPQTLAAETEVIARERAYYNQDPGTILEDRLLNEALGGHTLAWPLAGATDSLIHVDAQTLTDYWHRVVQGSRLVVTISGGFDPDAVRRALSPLAEIATGRPATATPPQWQTTGGTLPLPPANAGRLVWLLPAPAFTDNQWRTARIANHLTGGGLTARLVRALRDEHQIAYAVRSRLENYSDMGLWWLEVDTEPERVTACDETIEQVLAELADHGPTPGEILDAEAHLAANDVMDRDDLQSELERAALTAFFQRQATPAPGSFFQPGSVTQETLRAQFSKAFMAALKARI